MNHPVVDALRLVLDASGLVDISSPEQAERHLQDWRGRYTGQALCMVRPATTDQVAEVIRVCRQHRVSVVPQGGNTGLVGGSIPDKSGQQVLLSLQRLRQVLAVDPANLTITVQAGCLLADVQEAARAAGLLFPLSLASEGTCTIGGNLATNAGGTQVLRYGTARDLCLGLEAVTASGDVWSNLKGLRKDNTGYDLRDLFIGSEGTLGVITAATLRLYPQPRGETAALAACDSLEAAVDLLKLARNELDAGLTAFEVMAQLPLSLLDKHLPEVARILAPLRNEGGALPAWLVLIENASAESASHAETRLDHLLQRALELDLISNAMVARQSAQHTAMWQVREGIPLAEKAEGLMVKHDIGLPTSAIPEFVRDMAERIHARWPQAQIVCFGHLGDGNLHYNVQAPDGQRQGDALLAFEADVNELVFGDVVARQGTISAEHGIGRLRKAELARRQSPVANTLMRALKQTLDPDNILNPGRVV
ncbi:FAD-binding oxidoreductase [Aquabacterium sp.]|uniref:FAD-binding oxidoreductase n=1 Tax=Aquabacterium sp. TaxID=1872578 RepID=UPI0035B4CEAE